jgi:hypothetical protein
MIARRQHTALLLLIALAVLIATYWLARYGGRHDEGDAIALRFAAEAIIAEESLTPAEHLYANGYAFPALLAALALVTGRDPAAMQLLTTFWLAAIVIAAFVAYRRLLRSDSLALLAALALLLMPDFLFPVLRASHERVTWTFSLLILVLWVGNLDTTRPRPAAALVAATYILFGAMIAANVFLASTVLATFALALGLLTLLGLGRPAGRSLLPGGRRMAYVLITGLLLVFLFIFYVYPPARAYLFALENLVDRLAVTLLGAEAMSAPYSLNHVRAAWRSPATYAGLVAVQYGVLLASFAAWLRLGGQLLRREPRVSAPDYLLWLLYFGIGGQFVIGLLADYSGAFAGNLQVRYLPALLILAAPLAARWLKGWPSARSSPIYRRAAGWALLALCGVGLVAALLKATNDPLVGNFWTFYTPQERQAGRWVEEYLTNGQVWVDISAHKLDVLRADGGPEWQPTNQYRTGAIDPSLSHYLISDLTLRKAARYGFALPALAAQNRIYDTGAVQLFHRPPATPFQK